MRRLIAAAGEAPADDDARNVNHALTALADHWWVETQTGGVWRASDLLAGDPSKPLATADRTIDPAAIPVGLYHQVTIRVVIERWAAGITSEKTALQQTFQPAQTIGVPITLSITAGNPLKAFPAVGQDAAATFRAHAIGQHEWTPSLDIGTQHVVQNAITDSGNVTVPSNDTDVLAVAKGVTHGLAGAIDDVFGSGPPASASPAPAAGAASILSAAWIEYRIAAPGEPVQTVRRQIFDLPGPAARAAKSTTWRIDDAGKLSRSLSLTMTTDILPANCALAPQFVEHLSRQTLLANASVAQDIVSGRITDDFAGVQSASGRMVKTGTSLYDLATRRLNSSPVAPFVYVDRPDILTRHLFFTGNGTALTPTGATDIVANGVGVDPTGPSRFTMAIAQGVYDTSGEAALYSIEPNPGNAAWAFGAGGDWITIAKPGTPALATLQVGADVRERVDAALASNHIVIVPRSRVPVGGGTFAGWWQVDKSTGETLGMGETGWGQELAEYTVVMAAGWGFVTGWLFCKLAPRASGGAPIVAANAAHPPRTLFDVFEIRVEASSDSCIGQAFLSAGMGLVGAGFGAGTGGGSSDPGEVGRSLPEDPVDPFAKTQPVPAVGNGGSGGADGTGGAAGGGGSAGAGGGAGGGSGEPPSANPSPPGAGGSNPDPDAAARFQDAKRRYEQLFDSPDVLGRQQALKEMMRNQPRGIPDDLRNALDEDIRQLAEQRAARGLGTAGGGTSGADQLPPTLRSAGVGSGGAGQGSGGAGGGSGTEPGLGQCAPNCGPSGTTTLVGLGGAMNALGGGS